MNENKMPLKDALQLTIDRLYQINVPVELLEQIALPIKQAAMNLEQCIVAIDCMERKAGENNEVSDPQKEVSTDA